MRGHYRDREMRYHMKHMAALLTALCVGLPNGMALAAEATSAASDNRASLLHIVLVGGLLIVVGNVAIFFAKRKMEKEAEAAKEKADAERQEKNS